MALLSLLPAPFSTLETWLTRLFLILALIIIGPWAFVLVYDLALYLVRSLAHDIPVVGGRARGKARPRAPSLTERPSGRRRFSLARRGGGRKEGFGADARWRRIREEGGESTTEGE